MRWKRRIRRRSWATPQWIGDSHPPHHHHNLNQKQASLLREALDLACDKLFNEISIKDMLEPDDGTSRKIFTPPTKEELGSYNALVDSPVIMHPSSVFFPPSLETQVDVFSANSFQQSRDDVVKLQRCVGDSTSPGDSLSAGGSLPVSSATGTPTADQKEASKALLSPGQTTLAESLASTFAPPPSSTPPTLETGGRLRGRLHPHRRASCLHQRSPWGPRWGPLHPLQQRI
jgi:hypothetical protein